MGSLAGLLSRTGHRVSGSDVAFHPPMGDALERWGIEKREGYCPTNLSPAPDLVVVGNVCRPDNPEARAAIDGGLPYTSFPGALRRMFLAGRRSFVVGGTHGKTTTSALLAYLLDRTGRSPGFLIGGLPLDFEESFRECAEGAPFVVEGDEYDSAFFEKSPKFWQYEPAVAAISAIEHDHIDIYPDMDAYREAFVRFVSLLEPDGLLVANAADPEVRAVAAHARCRVSYYALDGDDTGDISPQFLAAPSATEGELQPFDLFYGGSACGRVRSPLSGRHNVRNAVAALAMAAEGAGVPLHAAVRALTAFGGVRRRQELRGVADGVRVYDDFAHHPSAVALTLAGLRARHPEGRLWALFEPRSATASRRLHQAEYPAAFAPADVTLLAPVGRPEIADGERLDVAALAAEIGAAGGRAEAMESIRALVARVVAECEPGDTVVVMSNGPFGGAHDDILAGLASRLVNRRTGSGGA